MDRFLDIASCLFHPPQRHEDVQLRPNEMILQSIGDTRDYAHSKMMKNPESLEKLESNSNFVVQDINQPSLQDVGSLQNLDNLSQQETDSQQVVSEPAESKEPTSWLSDIFGPSNPNASTGQTPVERPPKSSNNKVSKYGHAISLPYMSLTRGDHQQRDYTVIYLHANSEDIVSSLHMTRVLFEIFKANIIVPEYRGYSLLKEHEPNMDQIKTDLRFFVKEMIKRGLIEPERTILFGRSLGSHFASYLSSRFAFHSTIIFCGFQSIARVVEQKTTPFLGKIIKQKCDNKEYLKQTKTRVFLIHGMKVEFAK